MNRIARTARFRPGQTRQLLAALTAAVVTTAGLAACVPTSTAAAPPAVSSSLARQMAKGQFPPYHKHVTLTFWTFFQGEKALISNFEKHYPSIKVVTPLESGADMYTKLQAALSAGAGAPDVVLLEGVAMPQYVSQHYFLNIAPYVNGFRKDFPGWVWQADSQGSKVYGVPYDTSPYALAYRPDIFSKYHLAVPTTYQQFAQEAVSLHHQNPSMYMMYIPLDLDMEALFRQAGAEIYRQTPKGWVIAIDQPITERVVNYWVNLARQGGVQPIGHDSVVKNHNIATKMYASYFVYPAFLGSGLNQYISPAGSQHFSLAQIPAWGTGGSHVTSFGGVDSVAVTTQTAHPDAAALLAAFLAVHSSSVKITLAPTTQGGADSFPALNPSLWSGVHVPPIPNFPANSMSLFEHYAAAINHGYTFSPWDAYFTPVMNTEILKAAAGQESARQALVNTENTMVRYARQQGVSVTASHQNQAGQG